MRNPTVGAPSASHPTVNSLLLRYPCVAGEARMPSKAQLEGPSRTQGGKTTDWGSSCVLVGLYWLW